MTLVAPIPAAPARPRTIAPVRRWGLRPVDLWAVLGLNLLLITGMWVRHGGLETLHGPGGLLTGAGQLAGLYGTLAVLSQILLMSRSPWLEQLIGRDRIVWGHRWIGFASVWLLVGHAILITLGYAASAKAGIWAQTWDLLTTYPDVAMSAGGLGLFLAVAFTSMRRARRKLQYETWFFVHLYAYLAVALSFAHQLAVGTDFVDDVVARAYWIALYLAVFGCLIAFRVAQPLVLLVRHRPRVVGVTQEAPGVVSIHVGGRNMEQLAADPGQFFNLRLLTARGWWRAHPFSLSAAPDGRTLRFTVKALGDWTDDLQRVPVGTRLVLEGPYGTLTLHRRRKARVLLVAGGVGLTPLRAILDKVPARDGVTQVLYRAPSWDDVLFRHELEAFAAHRKVDLGYLVGRRGTAAMPGDPFEPRHLLAMCPDVRQREVFVCGPHPMMDAVEHSLRTLGVPADQIHSERFEY